MGGNTKGEERGKEEERRWGSIPQPSGSIVSEAAAKVGEREEGPKGGESGGGQGLT